MTNELIFGPVCMILLFTFWVRFEQCGNNMHPSQINLTTQELSLGEAARRIHVMRYLGKMF